MGKEAMLSLQPVPTRREALSQESLQGNTWKIMYQRETYQPPKKLRAYEPAFDSEKYQQLQTLRWSNPQEYQEQKTQLDAYTEYNVMTGLGEYLHAGLFRRRDEIRNGVIYGQNTNEPLLTVIERGIAYRKQQGSSFEDQRREQAEGMTFAKIQKELCSPEAKVGTTVFVVSPSGKKDSAYTHNFYDAFTLREEKGVRFVEVNRYSSGLTKRESAQRIRKLDPTHKIAQSLDRLEEEVANRALRDEEIEGQLDDVLFLSEPVKLAPGRAAISAPDELHAFLHQQHDHLTQEAYQAVIYACKPFIHAFLEVLSRNPYDYDGRDRALRALFNKAYETKEALKDGGIAKMQIIYARDSSLVAQEQEIARYGFRAVQKVEGDCGTYDFDGGFSGGYGYSSPGGEKGAFSVIEFGVKTLECTCPFCKKKVKAKIANGKITCPNLSCGKSAPYNC